MAQTGLASEAAQVAAILKSIANENRLFVLCLLAECGEASVGALVEHVGLSQSAMSQHLARMRADGLLTFRREAQAIYYRIADPRIDDLLGQLHRLYCRKTKGKASPHVPPRHQPARRAAQAR